MSESRVLKLEIALSEATEKKIKSLAMLSPEAATQLEQQLTEHLQSEISEYFDRTVTEALLHHMGLMDGRSYGDLNDKPQIPAEAPTPPAEPKLETVHDAAVRKEAEHTNDTDHVLAEDDDPQDNKSVEEQAAELAEKLAKGEEVDIPGIGPSQVKAPNVEEDAEAFLDAAMGSQEKRSPRPAHRPVRDGDVFDPRRRQAHISAYGDEEPQAVPPGFYP